MYTFEAISAANTLYVIRCIGWNCNISVVIVDGGREASLSMTVGLGVNARPYRYSAGDSRMLDHERVHDVFESPDRAESRSVLPSEKVRDPFIEIRLGPKRLSCQEAADHYPDPLGIFQIPLGPHQALRLTRLGTLDRLFVIDFTALLQMFRGCYT